MKRPLIMVALLYSGGLLLGNNVFLPLPWLFLGAFVFLIAAFFSARNFYLAPLILLTGWINLAARTSVVSPNDLRLQIGNGAEYSAVRGRLRTAPVHRVFEIDSQESWRTLAQLEITAIRRGETWQPAFGRVMASTVGVLDEGFCAGQTVEVTGILRPPRQPLAEGLFDYRAYLAGQGIHYQLAVEATNDWVVVEPIRSRPLGARFIPWAQKVLLRGQPMEDEPVRLVWAMTLGWKTALSDEVSEPFMKSGTMHIFAISGLHIALIAGILVALLRVLQVPRGWCAFIAIPLLWFYTMATGWQPSAIRSTIMMTIIVAGWSLKRPTDLLNSLSAAALIILVWDPQQLFQASFQLSFFVVLSIALLMPSFHTARERWLNPDPLLPPELRSPWRKRLDFPLRYATTAFATSLAAWLGSLPLIAYYFHLVTPVSLGANFVIVPLASFALMANLGSLFCGTWFPWMGELFNHAGWFFMKLMIDSSHWFASLPFGHLYVPTPSILSCGVYYLLLFTVLNGWLLVPRKRLATLSLMVIALVLGAWHWRTESRTVKITVLPLSGGDAIFVDAPGRADDLLIDCGNEKNAEFVVEPFLRGQGVNRLENLLLTHGDLKHVGGTRLIRETFAVKKVFASPAPFRSAAYREIISELQTQPGRLATVTEGDRIGSWEVLHPQTADRFPQADDKAIVLRGEFFGKTILLLSDLGRLGQNALLERQKVLKSDFVVSGLPTQSEPLGNALIEAIHPGIMVITDAEFPATERASRKLRERLDAQKQLVIYCRDEGAVSFVFDKNSCTIRTASGLVINY